MKATPRNFIRLLFSNSAENCDYDDDKPKKSHKSIKRSIFFRPSIMWILGGTLLIALLVEVPIYYVGSTTAKFYGLLLSRNFAGFWMQVLLSTSWIALSSVLKSALHYGSGLFALEARAKLTRSLQSEYLKPRVFRQLNSSSTVKNADYDGFSCNSVADEEQTRLLQAQSSTAEQQLLDNPDQRLSQDIDQWCSVIRVFVEQLIASPVMIIYYSYKTAGVGGYPAPLAVYAYFLINLLVCRPLLPRLVQLTYRKERLEGNFRYFHQRTRHFADSINMLRGERNENRFLGGEFDKIIAVQQSILNREYFVRVVTTFISEFGSIISFLLIAVPVFTGQLDRLDSASLSTLISQNTFYTMYLIYKFTSITEMADRYSQLMGYSKRIQDLLDSLSETQKGEKREEQAELRRVEGDEATENQLITAKVMTENDRETVCGIQIEVHEDAWIRLGDGRSTYVPPFKFPFTGTDNASSLLLITGPPGIGKSTLIYQIFDRLQSLGDKYDCGQIMFLPQRTYLPAQFFSTDRWWEECVLYPLSIGDDGSIDRNKLSGILMELGLPLINWSAEECSGDAKEYKTITIEEEHSDVKQSAAVDKGTSLSLDPRSVDPIYRLSPGEKQKLALASAIYAEPRLLIMDEPFSSLDPQTIQSALRIFKHIGIHCLIVTHQPEMLESAWSDQSRRITLRQ